MFPAISPPCWPFQISPTMTFGGIFLSLIKKDIIWHLEEERSLGQEQIAPALERDCKLIPPPIWLHVLVPALGIRHWWIPWCSLMHPYWGTPPKTQTSQYSTAPQLAGTSRTWDRKGQVLYHKYKRIREWRESEVKTKKVQPKFEVVKMKNGTVPFTGG